MQDGDGRDTAESACFLAANRNKRSATCDIASPEGQALVRELVRELVRHYEVFVENHHNRRSGSSGGGALYGNE